MHQPEWLDQAAVCWALPRAKLGSGRRSGGSRLLARLPRPPQLQHAMLPLLTTHSGFYIVKDAQNPQCMQHRSGAAHWDARRRREGTGSPVRGSPAPICWTAASSVLVVFLAARPRRQPARASAGSSRTRPWRPFGPVGATTTARSRGGPQSDRGTFRPQIDAEMASKCGDRDCGQDERAACYASLEGKPDELPPAAASANGVPARGGQVPFNGASSWSQIPH